MAIVGRFHCKHNIHIQTAASATYATRARWLCKDFARFLRIFAHRLFCSIEWNVYWSIVIVANGMYGVCVFCSIYIYLNPWTHISFVSVFFRRVFNQFQKINTTCPSVLKPKDCIRSSRRMLGLVKICDKHVLS